MRIYSLNEGEELVRAARACIELYLLNPKFNASMVRSALDHFEGSHGISVYLEHYPTGGSRGHSARLGSKLVIGDELITTTLNAAFNDKNHVPVSRYELGELLVTVSVLSDPEQLTGKTQKAKRDSLSIGKHGLMLEYGTHTALIMPDETLLKSWDKLGMLEELCIRAKLHKNYWTQPKVKIYKFEAQIFKEETPSGKVIEITY